MARNYWKDRQAKALANLSNKSAKAIEEQLKKYYQRTMQTAIADFEATYDKLLGASQRPPTFTSSTSIGRRRHSSKTSYNGLETKRRHY